MCGRFSLATDEFSVKVYLANRFNINRNAASLDLPRYNIAPGQMVLSLINDGRAFRHGYLKWGYVPDYDAKSQNPQRIINLRSETILEKSYLAASVAKRRCVILADGFYEWRKTSTGKIPFRIRSTDQELFPMAGLWNSHTDSRGNKEHTVAILTVAANGIVKDIHERMPVILNDTDAKLWLEAQPPSLVELKQLLLPYPDELTTMYEVSDIVNSYANESPACIVPAN